MIRIVSNKVHSPKVKRRVRYQPETQTDNTNDKSMSDLLREQLEKEQNRQRDLEHTFRDKIRSSATGWSCNYVRAG